MNKETKKIFNKISKSYNKEKQKLLKICKKYSETGDDVLLPEISYYADKIFEDSQVLLLIEMITENE